MSVPILESLGMDIIRGFFALIDNVIYSLIAGCYKFIDILANIQAEESLYSDISGRIYAILGIFMLFKVSFSFINYIVKPDTMTDKDKGVQKVIQNIVIMFIMLIMCPWAFKQLYGLQNALLEEGFVEALLFGKDTTGEFQFQMSSYCGENNFAKIHPDNKGDYVSLLLFRPFYQLTFDDLNKLGAEDSEVRKIYCTTETGKGKVNVSHYLQPKIYNRADNIPIKKGFYRVSYLFLVSTVAGVLALGIIVSMLLDIALRAIKLIFLQLVAPVPIISYIDPKSGQNGIFSKWLKEVGKTWISLFIKLFAFNFALFMINAFVDGKVISGDNGIFVNVFVIIGCLMFVKKLPQMISDIFGIKLDGGFSINPLKKFQDEALGGKQIVKAAGAGASMTASAIGSGISHGIARHRIKQKLQENQNEMDKLQNSKGFNEAQILNNRNQLQELQKRRYDATQRYIKASNAQEKYKAKQAVDRIKEQEKQVNANITDLNAKSATIKDQIDIQQGKIDDIESSRLYKNKVRGYAGEIAHGLKHGAQNGYQKPGHLIHDTAEAIKDSSEERNYREKYSIKDQIADRATDVFGIKNESGTTSMVKKELKVQNDTLNEVNRSIEMLNRSISQMASDMGAEFSKAIQYAPNGRMEINASYTGSQSAKLPELEQIISAYYGRVDEKVRLEKTIKDLQDTVDSVKPGGSGKPKK